MQNWEFLVHFAAILQIFGFFFRDQIILRVLIIAGSSLYVLYYWLFPAEPLWTAIFWTTMIAVANICMIFFILHDRYVIHHNQEEALIYRAFTDFTPGMFRKLMSVGELKKTTQITTLTQEGQTLNQLFYIIDGGLRVEKQDKVFDYMPGVFVGEIVFLSGGRASATVSIPANSRYVEWQNDALQSVLRKNPETRIKFEAMLNRDLAQKVRFA